MGCPVCQKSWRRTQPLDYGVVSGYPCVNCGKDEAIVLLLVSWKHIEGPGCMCNHCCYIRDSKHELAAHSVGEAVKSIGRGRHAD